MATKGTLRTTNSKVRKKSTKRSEKPTRMNKELFWKARSKGKDWAYNCVWVKRGKIYARKSDDSLVVNVISAHDLDKRV